MTRSVQIELCGKIQAVEIVNFHKAYVDFAHLVDLAKWGVF